MPADHPAWGFAADALAALCHNLSLSVTPERIFIGGGVATGQPQLVAMVRSRLAVSLAGYAGAGGGDESLDDYIVPPVLGDRAGPLGAIALARQALAGPGS